MVMLGYVRVTPRFSAGPQVGRLKQAGVVDRHIWIEGRDAETWNELLKTVRPDDTVVVDGLHRLGLNREAVHRAILDLRNKGGQLRDAGQQPGYDPLTTAFASVMEALRVLAGEQRIPSHAEAVRRGKQGGRPGYDRLKTAANKKIWQTAKSNLDAQRKTGVAWRTMHRWWGPSGRPAGWPKK